MLLLVGEDTAEFMHYSLQIIVGLSVSLVFDIATGLRCLIMSFIFFFRWTNPEICLNVTSTKEKTIPTNSKHKFVNILEIPSRDISQKDWSACSHAVWDFYLPMQRIF